MLDKYERTFGACDPNAAGAEACFNVGITVLDKRTGQLIRQRSTGHSVNLVVALDASSGIYSMARLSRIAGTPLVCHACKSLHASSDSLLRHKRLNCRALAVRRKYVGGGFWSKASRDLWTRLAVEGLRMGQCRADRFPHYLAVYDFECRFEVY